MKKTSQKGFTLIELMVVILIIAILGALGIVSFTEANKSSRDAKRKTDIESVKQAMLLYKQENTGYPAGSFSTIASALVTAKFLSFPPTDPKPAPYVQYNRSDSASTTDFCICATLEGTKGNATNSSCAGLTTPTLNGTHYCAKP